MVAARQLEATPHTAAEDLRKQVIRLLQANGEDTKGNILVLPQVFLEFLDYDHKMALFLNKLLYWTERTKNPQKWVYKTYNEWYQELGFKESVVRRLLHGDPSTKTRKRTLTDIGVEVKVKRAPNGSPTCHYRINLEIFLDAIRQFLAEQQGTTERPETANSTGSNLRDQPNGKPESHAIVSAGSAGTCDQETTAKISSEGNTSKSSCIETHDDDLDIFFSFESKFGKLKDRFHEPFRAELRRLGMSRVGEVLERCALRARSWKYVATALANEAASASAQTEASLNWGELILTNNEGEQLPFLQPQEAAPALFISESVQRPWQGFGEPVATAQSVWEGIYHQLEMQLDRGSFEAWVRGAALVDFNPDAGTFVLVVRTAYAQDALRGRLDRMVKRIAHDLSGQPVEVQYLLQEEWHRLREDLGRNVAIA